MPPTSIYLTKAWLFGSIFHHLLSPILCIFTIDGTSDGNGARQKIDATEIGLRFEGNTSFPDFFKLLERDGNFLLIGARNVVYNISINNFDVQTLIFWPSLEEDVEMCLMKGKSKDDCHNYIRTLAKEDQTGLLVCGTNAFKPMCRRYVYKGEAYEVTSEFSASGVTPYDPSHRSASFYEPDTRDFYAGTVADFAGTDALISRRNIAQPDELGLRTERSDINCLNEPVFVSSLSDSDHVYFWLHEDAVEFSSCGKASYSRVARVCKNDRGGPRASGADFWTSFAKLRLNCSLPGDFPFYFDEIVATSNIVKRTPSSNQRTKNDHDSEFVYAVFDTPYSNTVGGSAVCIYSMRQIREAFRQSPFKSQSAPNSNWQTMPRPQGVGDCNTNSRSMSLETMNFVRKNSLLDAVLPNYFNSPLMVQTGARRFRQITVDPQVKSVDGQRYDVIFLATDDGKIMKTVNLMSPKDRFSGGAAPLDQPASLTVVVEIAKIFENSKVAINNMQIFRPAQTNSLNENDAQLIVVSDDLVRSVPLYNCMRATTCYSCVHLQDPYCAWDPLTESCVGSSTGWDDKKYVQNVTGGFSRLCFGADELNDNPDLGVVKSIRMKNSTFDMLRAGCECSSTGKSINNDDKRGSYVSSEKIAGIFSPSIKTTYTIESMIIAVIVASLISCLVGLTVGLRLGKSTICWSLFFAKFGAKKCQSPVISTKGALSNMKQKNAIKRLFSIKPPPTNQNAAPINAYEYDPPKLGDYKYLNESTMSTTNGNSFGTPDYCNKSYCRSSPTTHNGSTVRPSTSVNSSTNDFVDVALSPMPIYSTDTASTNINSNYSTMPKDYKVKKTYL